VQYEVQRAFEQYDQADPANRLVVDVLEQRWNAKLEALETLRGELYAKSDVVPSLSAADKKAVLALGQDFAAVWGDPARAR
jgi:hypothetical protein